MKPYSFQEYELITDQINKSKFYKIIILIIIIGLIYIISNYKFNIYEKAIIYKEDNNNYYLLLDISKDFNINYNKYLIINNKKYKYGILNNVKYSNINGTIYKSISIIFDTDSHIDEYTQINYLIKSNTILNMIFELLGGG